MKTEVQDTEMYYGLEKDNEVEYDLDKKPRKDYNDRASAAADTY